MRIIIDISLSWVLALGSLLSCVSGPSPALASPSPTAESSGPSFGTIASPALDEGVALGTGRVEASAALAPSPIPSPSPAPKPSPRPRPSPASPYYLAARAALATRTLSNGVPIAVYRDAKSLTCALSLVLKGGAIVLPEGKDGIERLALQAMAKGIRGAPRGALASLSKALSARIGIVSCDSDFSSFSLLSPAITFDRSLEALAGCFADPAFQEADFLEARDESIALARNAALAPSALRGHPYARSTHGTAASLGAMTLPEIKAWAEKMVCADRLMVVAVGPIDPDYLAARLEGLLSRLPRRGYLIPPTPELDLGVAVEAEIPAGGLFAMPGLDDRNFAALALASSIISQRLSERRPGPLASFIRVRALARPYAEIVFDERDDRPSAIEAFKAASLSLAGSEVCAKDLEAAKASYLLSLYSGRGDKLALASQVASLWVRCGDPLRAFEIVDQVGAVDSGELSMAVRDYLLGNKIEWFGSGGK